MKITNLLFIIFTSLTLCACTDDNNDLTRYIKNIKGRPEKTIEPIPPVVSLSVFKFSAQNIRRNPFKPAEQQRTDELSAPNQKRPKEPLEAFPLDVLNFVGTLQQGSELWALIEQPDSRITRVQAGEYMGQNYGLVLLINDSQITLEETVKNSDKWEKHRVTLNLMSTDLGKTGV